jgi:hypothetical protein
VLTEPSLLIFTQARFLVSTPPTFDISDPRAVYAIMPAEIFTAILRGETFMLSQEQLEFDSPNFFTNLFLGSFAEAESRRVELARNPDIFRIIIDYMSGYPIVPLSDVSVPRMTAIVANQCLLVDAEFYGLRSLVTLVQAELPNASHFMANHMSIIGVSPISIEMDDLTTGNLPFAVVADTQEGLYEQVSGARKPVVVIARNIQLR